MPNPYWHLYGIDEQDGNYLLRKSTDHGQRWDSVSTPFPSSAQMVANPLNTQYIYFGTLAAPYRSDDAGQTFQIKENNMINTYIYELAVNPLNPVTLYAGGYMGFWKSTNSGGSWTRLSVATTNAIAIDPQYPDTLYRGCEDLLRRFDGGNTWVNIKDNIPGIIVDIKIRDDSTQFIFVSSINFSSSYLFKSSDFGQSWTLVFTSSPAGFTIVDIEIQKSNPQIMYFGSTNNLLNHGLYKSSDGGDTWTKISDPGQVVSIALHPTNLDTIYIATPNKVLCSSDGGYSFTEIAQSIQSQHISKVVLDTANTTRLMVSTKDQGVFYSFNNGKSWQQLPGEYDSRITDVDLVPHENRVFLSSHGYGVWRGDNMLVTIDEEENEPLIPQKIQLFPAFPNPFNQSVTIPFHINKKQSIELAVYDIQGKLIKQLMKKQLNTGFHHVRWDGRNENGLPIASGIYIIRLQSGSTTLVGKVLLLK